MQLVYTFLVFAQFLNLASVDVYMEIMILAEVKLLFNLPIHEIDTSVFLLFPI